MMQKGRGSGASGHGVPAGEEIAEQIGLAVPVDLLDLEASADRFAPGACRGLGLNLGLGHEVLGGPVDSRLGFGLSFLSVVFLAQTL